MSYSLRTFIARLETRLLQTVFPKWPQDQFPQVALAGVPAPLEDGKNEPQSIKSTLESIFDAILLAAVPKRRRSLERRHMRRMGEDKIRKHLTPRENLVSCLECGSWHEAYTVCGTCYDKVRKETEAMRAAMNEDDRLYSAPKTEVVYLYEDEKEERPMHAGKYIVELDQKRPEWWSVQQLSKGNK